jgi:hypothetical protein
MHMLLKWPTGRVNMTTENVIDVRDLVPKNGVRGIVEMVLTKF